MNQGCQADTAIPTIELLPLLLYHLHHPSWFRRRLSCLVAREPAPRAACSPSPVLHVNRDQSANVILHCSRNESGLDRPSPRKPVGNHTCVLASAKCVCVCVCIRARAPVCQSHDDPEAATRCPTKIETSLARHTVLPSESPSGGLLVQSVSDASESTTTCGMQPSPAPSSLAWPGPPGLPLHHQAPPPSPFSLLCYFSPRYVLLLIHAYLS